MKRLLFILALLIASPAFAQAPPFVYRPTPAAIGCPPGQPSCSASALLDNYGKQMCVISGGGSASGTASVIPVSSSTGLNGFASGLVGWATVTGDTAETTSTTTSIKATAHSARIGDVLFFNGGTAGNLRAWSYVTAIPTADLITISPALPATPANGDAFVIIRPVPVSSSGIVSGQSGSSLEVGIDANYQVSTSTGILKPEDAASASGDALVGVATVRNDGLTTLAGTALDYSALASGTFGQALSTIIYDANIASGASPVRQEDLAFSDGQALIVTGAQREDALTANTGTSGDLTPLKTDSSGRLITTMAPMGETFSVCSSAATGTAFTTIKAAVASNRIYVTSLTCSNNSAVASQFALYDGSGGTLVGAGGVGTLAATGGGFHETFPVPIRGSVNTAFGFQMTTTSTSTTCCAQGYTSTQ